MNNFCKPEQEMIVLDCLSSNWSQILCFLQQDPFEGYMSRPLLRLLLGDIGFVYPVMSMMVIGPSLPILRQRRWSLMYDVY